MRTLFLVFLCLCAAGLASIAPAQTNAAGHNAAGHNKEIDAVRAEWVRDLEEQRLEPSIALFTDDAAFLNPDGSRFAGKDAIRGLYRQIFTELSGQITLDTKQVVVSDSIAYESGLFQETLTTKKTGAKQQMKGSYLMVYRRDPGGKWRIAQQAWMGTPPVT